MSGESDDLDRAATLTQQLNEAYIGNARALARPEQVKNPDGTWPFTECECGEALGDRMHMGKIRCLNCQLDFEKEARCRR